jgi:hypothetical protein
MIFFVCWKNTLESSDFAQSSTVAYCDYVSAEGIGNHSNSLQSIKDKRTTIGLIESFIFILSSSSLNIKRCTQKLKTRSSGEGIVDSLCTTLLPKEKRGNPPSLAKENQR